jgi:hypothetical protein
MGVIFGDPIGGAGIGVFITPLISLSGSGIIEVGVGLGVS